MKTLTAIACTLCACAFAAARQLTGLESVTRPGDATNGGFWDASGRGAMTVGEGSAALGTAIATACRSSDAFVYEDVFDTRAFTWGESPAVAIRTDKVAFLLLVR